MAEREKLVYIVLDEANRPTSLGAFEDGDTIPSGTLPTNVRTAVEDVDTLNTRVDNLDTSVGDLSTAIDAIEVGAVDASVLAAAQFVTDSSGDIIDSSNAVVTLDTRVGNVETSTTNLSSYINSNESAWTAGIDAGTLADLTAVSSVVSDTSGANGDIVTSYGPFSGEASGVSAAANVFASVNGTTAVINRDFNFNSKDITNINSLEAKGGFSLTGNITIDGTVDGVNIATRDAYLTSLATSSEEVSAVVATNTGNIATNTTNITNLTTSSEELSGAIDTLDGTLTNVQGSTVALSSYINANESSWAAGIDAGTLADIQEVSTVVTTTSGANDDIVTSYGPYSGLASGVSAAGATIAGLSTGLATLKRSLSLANTYSIIGVNTLSTVDVRYTGNLSGEGDLSSNGNFYGGTLNGIDVTALDDRVTTAEGNITNLTTSSEGLSGAIDTLDAYVTDLATSSEEVSAVVATNTGNITTNTTNITNLTTSAEELSGAIDTLDAYVTDLATSSEEVSAVVATNTGNIATNTGNISTNTTNITNLTTSSEELSAVITSNTGNIENLVNAFYIEDGVYYTSGFRVGSSGIPFDEATSILDHAYYGYNATKEKFELVIPPIVDDGLGVAVFTATEGINEGSFDLPITVNQAMTFSGGATLQFSGSGGSVDFGDASNISFGSQQTFTPSSNTFATRNILVGNELSSGPECVVNLEGSTFWASGSVLSAGSGCDITLRGDKFFYGPTNIYGPLGTDLDLDGNNLIDVNNITTANTPLTLQVTGAVNAVALNIKNTSTGISASGAVNVEAVGNVSVSAGDTVDITAPTVNLDGTGLFGLSGGAVQIEATNTYVTIDAGAYINVESTLNSSYKANNNLTLSATNDLRLESASTDIEITTPTFDTDTFGVCCTNWNTGYTKATSPGYMARANASTQNLNGTNVALELSTAVTSNGSDITWSSANPTRLTIGTTGTYRITFNIYGETSVTQRANIFAQMRIDGTTFAGPIAAGGYIRVQSGHNEASVHASFLYPLTSGQYIEIVGNQAAASGNWDTTIGTSQVSIELIH